MEDTAKNYPRQEYLTALDAATELEEAKERALGSIAKIFAVRIEDDALLNRNELTTQAKQERSDYLSRSTLAVARDEIDGIVIAQTWYDDKADLYYALAVLNKKEAASRWRRSATLLKSKIASETYVEQPPFRAIMLLMERQQYLGEYNRLAHRLQVVAPSNAYSPIVDNTPAMVRQQSAQIDFHISGSDAALIAAAEASLAAQGMRRGSATAALMRIDLAVGEERISKQDNWYIHRQELMIAILYEGLVNRVIKWDIQDESTDSKTAARRIQAAKRNKISEELFSAIITALNS